jgi:hypothetical protein
MNLLAPQGASKSSVSAPKRVLGPLKRCIEPAVMADLQRTEALPELIFSDRFGQTLTGLVRGIQEFAGARRGSMHHLVLHGREQL